MTPRQAAEHWAATWKAAWESFDTEAILALYAPDVVVSIEPFREPHRGVAAFRGYVQKGFDLETEAVVQVSVPIVDEDRAVVAWWAVVREDNDQGTLVGTSILRFNAEGLVTEQWDTFNQSETRQSAPDGHGPFDTP